MVSFRSSMSATETRASTPAWPEPQWMETRRRRCCWWSVSVHLQRLPLLWLKGSQIPDCCVHVWKHPQTDQYGSKRKRVKKFRACLHYCTTASRKRPCWDVWGLKSEGAAPLLSYSSWHVGLVDPSAFFFWLQRLIFLRVPNGAFVVGFQTSPMLPSTWCCPNKKVKAWNSNGSLEMITTARLQVLERKSSECHILVPTSLLYLYHIIISIQLHMFLKIQHKSMRSRHELGFSPEDGLRSSVGGKIGIDHSSEGLAWLSFCLSTEFVIEYEESQWEPGSWKELLRVPGNHNSAILKLHGHVDYCFRVSGVNAVGRGPSSQPTERYRTPPAGRRHPLFVHSTFLIRAFRPLNTVSPWRQLILLVNLSSLRCLFTRHCFYQQSQLNPYSFFFS